VTHAALILVTVAMASAGFTFGLLYFAALRRTATLIATRRGWFDPMVLTLGRIGAAVIFLALAAKLGAAPLLVSFTGLLLARGMALRATGTPD
jgi:N-ATPase, AtpR subunit